MSRSEGKKDLSQVNIIVTHKGEIKSVPILRNIGHPLLDFMEDRGIPLTRENYIKMNWWGKKTSADLSWEDELELPPQFQDLGIEVDIEEDE